MGLLKYGNTYYLELSRLIFNDEPYKSLSINAKWLFVVLKELEQRYTNGGEKDWFYRSNEDLADDMGVSLRTLKRAKAELLETDLVESWRSHFVYNKDTPEQKLSEKRVSVYRVKK